MGKRSRRKNKKIKNLNKGNEGAKVSPSFPGLSNQSEDANEFIPVGPVDAEGEAENQDVANKASQVFNTKVEAARVLITKVAEKNGDNFTSVIAQELSPENLKKAIESIQGTEDFKDKSTLKSNASSLSINLKSNLYAAIMK